MWIWSLGQYAAHRALRLREYFAQVLRPLCSQGGIEIFSRRGTYRQRLLCVCFLVVVVVGRDVRKFSVLKAEFQYPAFVGLVMYLCQIDQCLGLDWSF